MFSSLQYGQTGLYIDDRCCLMARMEGENAGTTFTDSSGLARATDRSLATTSTAQYKTGTASGSFSCGTVMSPTNGSWLTFKENLECVMRDDFTVQYWLRIGSRAPNGTGVWLRTFLSTGVGCIYSASIWMFEDGRIYPEAPHGRIFYWGTNSNGLYIGSESIPTGEWHHIAMCRYRKTSTNKITVEGWLDGVSIGTKDTDSVGVNVGIVIGSADTDADRYFGPYTMVGADGTISDVKQYAADCYIDELQIINGTAIYREGATFTPPAYEL